MRQPLLFLFLCLAAGLARGAAGQSHAAILETVRQYLETQVVPAGSEHSIDISPIDSRLQLAPCDGALEAFSLSDKRSAGLLTVGVRCLGGTPWTLYTRAKVALYQTVLVLRESIPLGTEITAAHLDFARKDVSGLQGGYFTAPEQAIGKRAKYSLTAGTMLSGNVLEMLKIIKRGEKVSIHLNNGMLVVEVEGTALADGEPGQRIRVRNESSKRIVEGTAVAPGVVEVR